MVAASRGFHPTCRPSARRTLPSTTAGNNEGNDVAAQPGLQAPRADSLPSLDRIHRKNVPTLKHIPARCRGLWARCLIRCLAAAVYYNSVASWTELEMLHKCVLFPPPSSQTKAHTNAAEAYTNYRLSRWLAGERTTLWESAPGPRRGRANNSEEARLTQSEALAREGFDKKATAALTSANLVEPSAAAATRLRPLHPDAPEPACPLFDQLPVAPLISADEINDALRSFPKDTAAGSSSLRAQHLLDACTKANKPVVLEQLAAVANILARGDAPPELAPFLAGASLFALDKKDGGIRPIAVGEILRRLVGKVLCKTVQDSATDYFWPHQVGVACSQGTECAVHVVNQWVARNATTANRVVLKLDFANAFNTVDRAAALAELRNNFPQLSRWAQWLYGHHSHLFFGERLLASQTGVQQGDPICPLLFSCAIHPLVRRIAQGFREAPANGGHGLSLFYLDDGILCGDICVVAEALQAVQTEGLRLGLELKLSKCELVLVSGEVSADLGALFPRDVLVDRHGRDRVVRDGNFEFLGARIGNDEHCAKVTKERVTEAAKTITAISKHSDPQIGQRLLRVFASFGKLVYSVRVVAPHAHLAELRRFDTLVRQGFSDITGLHPSDAEWDQATRGFDTAGLGLRSTADHGFGAYLASRANSWTRCREIDHHFTWEVDTPNSAPANALASLNTFFAPDQHLSSEILATTRQKAISSKIDEAKFQRQFASSPIPQKASLNSECLPGASGFLSAIPSKVLGLAFNPPEFIVELQTRLWMSVYQHDRFCPLLRHCA